jgi:UbiD family decarboxylase
MREFIAQLAANGELLIVREQVNPKYELAAVTKKIQATSTQAVLFENVARCSRRSARTWITTRCA